MCSQPSSRVQSLASMVFPTLDMALDDVEARFLFNLPESELKSLDRLFFQIEQAYWYYEDFKADVHDHLPHFKVANRPSKFKTVVQQPQSYSHSGTFVSSSSLFLTQLQATFQASFLSQFRLTTRLSPPS